MALLCYMLNLSTILSIDMACLLMTHQLVCLMSIVLDICSTDRLSVAQLCGYLYVIKIQRIQLEPFRSILQTSICTLDQYLYYIQMYRMSILMTIFEDWYLYYSLFFLYISIYNIDYIQLGLGRSIQYSITGHLRTINIIREYRASQEDFYFLKYIPEREFYIGISLHIRAHISDRYWDF